MLANMNQIRTDASPAIEGQWAGSQGNRYLALAGSGALIVADNSGNGYGVQVAHFVWRANATPDPVDGVGATASVCVPPRLGQSIKPLGIVPREQQATLQWHGDVAGGYIATGQPVEVAQAGDLWVRNAGATTSIVGQAVFARFTDGAAIPGTDGGTVTGAIQSKFFVCSVAEPNELMKVSTVNPLGA